MFLKQYIHVNTYESSQRTQISLSLIWQLFCWLACHILPLNLRIGICFLYIHMHCTRFRWIHRFRWIQNTRCRFLRRFDACFLKIWYTIWKKDQPRYQTQDGGPHSANSSGAGTRIVRTGQAPLVSIRVIFGNS